MNLAVWLERAALASPTSPALARGKEVISDYATLAGRVKTLAASLCERFGLAPDDRVGILAGNCPAYVEVLFAAWHAGLIAVPINAKLHRDEVAFILSDSGATVVFADSAHAETAKSAGTQNVVLLEGDDYRALTAGAGTALFDCSADHPAWLFYTSGTTGRPKGATLSHRNLQAMSTAYLTDVDGIARSDSLLHAAPMSHGSGLYILPHVCRGAVNVVPESGGFDPPEILALADVWSGITLFAAPTMVKRLVRYLRNEGDHVPNKLKSVIYGGGPMYLQDALEALETLGPILIQIYGQGESPMTITTLSRSDIADRDHPHHHRRLASVGCPFSNIQIRIVDSSGSELPAGEAGEITVRGDPVMLSYWQNQEATRATLRDGWLHTGDIGRFDEAGYLTLIDRSKDLIISGGSNIYPREVEEVLLSHPEVQEASVIGRPDPEWGEIVVAYVVGEATAAELDAHCLEHIARFKRPKAYVFRDGLPKNNYGKVLKTALRDVDRERLEQGERDG
ncbi:MAG: AMP-binding protein [Trueperaceae bacterium]|nr:MAG: AMP-binding protein [Trueperaceae bacterium]